MRVDNARHALAQLSAQAFNFPAKKLRIFGVTGTKGKTTTCFLLEHIMRSAGFKTALLSSVKNSILGHDFHTNLTTQHPDYLHAFFNECVMFDIDYVIMETAAQAFSLYRTWGIEFAGAIFTNFDLEHSEFYPTIDDYFNAKCTLLKQLQPGGQVIVNADDSWCQKLLSGDNVISIGFANTQAMVRGSVVDKQLHGLLLSITKNNHTYDYEIPTLMGIFNAYNALAAATLALQCGISHKDVVRAFISFTSVPGRLNKYTLDNGAYCFIDNAHNPSSYRAVLSTLRALTPHLIVVFGAGGDRDRIKRPIMGSIAAQLADIVIITSDNPRSENPESIAQEILQGIPKDTKATIIYELDREQAIKKAYACSQAGSIIALLGKGHDEYQLTKGTKTYFSEAKIIMELA